MIFTFVINTTILAWLWASCTLSIPLLWIDSASAASLPFSLKVLAQCIEIFAWVSGPFGFFAFFNTSFVVAVTFYIGEVLKIALTVILFSLVYVYIKVELIPLLFAYSLVMGVQIFSPMMFVYDRK